MPRGLTGTAATSVRGCLVTASSDTGIRSGVSVCGLRAPTDHCTLVQYAARVSTSVQWSVGARKPQTDTPALGQEFGASGEFEGGVALALLELLLLLLLELLLLILDAFETAVIT